MARSSQAPGTVKARRPDAAPPGSLGTDGSTSSVGAVVGAWGYLIGTGWKTGEALRAHPLLSRMPAVIEGRVVELPTQLLVTLSHHAADACWRLASLLHPQRVPRPRP